MRDAEEVETETKGGIRGLGPALIEGIEEEIAKGEVPDLTLLTILEIVEIAETEDTDETKRIRSIKKTRSTSPESLKRERSKRKCRLDSPKPDFSLP